jgi:hypothetical protein
MNVFTFDVRPADLLTVIAYFLDHPKSNLANGLRYDFQPDQPVRVMLDGFEEKFTLKGTHYKGYARNVRVWGRRRLELLQRVLPYAHKVTIGVLGRGLPHFYICHCGTYTFTLVLSGWTHNDWSKGSAFDLMVKRDQNTGDPEQTAAVYNYLSLHYAAPIDEIAAYSALDESTVKPILFELCRAGRVMYDPTHKQYRLRELFAEALDLKTLFAPDARTTKGDQLYAEGKVTILSSGQSEVRRNEIRTLATVDDAGTIYDVILSVDDEGTIRFAQCKCKFFRDNIMSRGPCEHILAVRDAYSAHTSQ